MNGAVVYKMSGSGNDFIFVDGRITPPDRWQAAQIRAICDRHRGVGADGLAILEPGSGPGRVRFHFYNCDGARSAMCGNGTLCATRMARELELVAGDRMILETDVGELTARDLDRDDLAEVDLGPVTEFSDPPIRLAPGERCAVLTCVGVPHLVLEVDDVESVPVDLRGRELRHHEALSPAGANVNFVSGNADGWSLRTFERGVESETLACGTGSVACAAVLAAQEKIVLPWDVMTASGRALTVDAHRDPVTQHLTHVRLTGEARLVFRAVIQ